MPRLYLMIIFLLLFDNTLIAQQTVGVFQNTEEAFNGYTLFSNNEQSYLIDNCGFIVNQWTSEFKPGLSTYLLDNGQLLRTARVAGNFPGGGQGGRVELFSWEGDLLWAGNFANDSLHAHHDIEPMPNGNFLAIVWSKKSKEQVLAAGRPVETEIWSEKILEVEILDNDEMAVVWEWDIWDHLIQDQDSLLPNYGDPARHPERLNINYTGSTGLASRDWIHLNAISYNEQLDQIAVSSRHLSEIWIIDHSTSTEEAASSSGGRYGKGGDLLYRFGNPQAYNRGTPDDQVFSGQHNIQWLPKGDNDEAQMMVFNNFNEPNRSSIEIWSPPVTPQGDYQLDTINPFGPAEIDREFVGTGFYSAIMSGVQLQPNGNLLICAADEGYFFEVNPDDEVVWEYTNPVNTNTGPVEQGDFARFNQTFRAERYAPDHPAFVGRSLVPGLPVELNPLSSDCEIYDSLVSSAPLLYEGVDLEIFGNPFKHHLSIRISDTEGALNLRIVDLLGKIIHQESLSSGSHSISLEAALPGIYFLQFEDQNGRTITRKVMKLND